MAKIFKEIEIGTKFDRLETIGPRELKEFSSGSVWCYPCKCHCGNTLIVRKQNLIHHNTRSCGCLLKEVAKEKATIHGMTGTSEHTAWSDMKARCLNKNNPDYKNYGGRGISIFEPWINDFMAFFNYIGPKPSPELTLERINNNGNYEPNNIKWATRKEQAYNQRKTNYGYYAKFISTKPI